MMMHLADSPRRIIDIADRPSQPSMLTLGRSCLKIGPAPDCGAVMNKPQRHEYLIRTDRVSVNFYLHTTYPVTDSRIVVQEFDGALILPKDRGRRMFVADEEPRQVARAQFNFDYRDGVGWCWQDRRKDSHPLTTDGLADRIIAMVLDLHERLQGK